MSDSANDSSALSASGGIGSDAGRKLSPEDATKLNAIAKRVSSAFGEIVGVLLRAPQYRHAFLSELEWLVLPALATGQFALAEARHKESGLAAPLAVLLWASVSDEVDARLGAVLSPSIKLKPAEWKSGPHLWLVDAVGEPRAVKALIDQTIAGPLKGKGLKIVTRDAAGKPAVKVLQASSAESAGKARTN